MWRERADDRPEARRPDSPDAAASAEPAMTSPAAPLQRCANPAPHGPHHVRPRRLTWTPFQCAGRPDAAERERDLEKAFSPSPLSP